MIVGVTGGKGGPGATVLAVGLARAFARRGEKTLLVDLDPWGGDTGVYLDPESLDPKRGLLPLLKLERGELTSDALVRELQACEKNLWVLLGFPRASPELLERRVSQVLRAASDLADIAVVDLGRAPVVINRPQSLDRLVVTTRPDLQGALAAQRCIATFSEQDSILVAARVGRGQGSDVIELSKALRRPVLCAVPEQPARRRGETPRFKKTVDHLATLLIEPPSAKPVAPKRLEEAIAR